MAEYWFKPKRYGYGATPVTWQGWVFTVATALAMAAVSVCLRLAAKSLWTLAALLIFDALALFVLVIVSRRKTEGEWHWRWGDR